MIRRQFGKACNEVSDLPLRTRKGILNDSQGEVVCCKLFDELSEWKKLVIGRESREKLRQIRNYEIRYKTSDECEVKKIAVGILFISGLPRAA